MRRLPEYLLLLYSLTGIVSITVSQVVMGAGALAALLDRGRRFQWRRTGLEGPVLAWMAATLLATVFSAEPQDSFGKMRKVLLFGMAWWPPAVLTRGWGLGRLYMGLLFGAGATSLYGVLIFFLPGGPELAVRIRGFPPFYLTSSGLLLLCTFPAVLFTFCRSLGSSFRWGAGIAAVSILAAQVLARLPGAWLGTAAGFAFLAVRRRRAWAALAVPAVVAGLALAPGFLREATRDMLDPAGAANAARVRLWENGLRLFVQDPWTGLGLQDLSPQYAEVKEPGDPDEGHMGSVPVQIAASMGVPGLAAFAWLVVALFRTLGRARRGAEGDPFLRAVVDSAEAGLVGFLAAGIVEWNFGDSEILALLFFLAGTAIAAGRIGTGADAARG